MHHDSSGAGSSRHAPDTQWTVEVRGRSVPLPVRIRTATLGAAVFPARLDVARSLLPDGLVPVVLAPRTALTVVLLADYTENDLGAYRELGVLIPCVPAARTAGSRGRVLGAWGGEVGTWVVHLPVTEEFTCVAGRELWGLPKTVEDLSVRRAGHVVVWAWRREGQEILRVAMRARSGPLALRTRTLGYTTHRRQLSVVESRVSLRGVRISSGGARIRFGPETPHLRCLFRSDRALATLWATNFAAELHACEPLVDRRSSQHTAVR